MTNTPVDPDYRYCPIHNIFYSKDLAAERDARLAQYANKYPSAALPNIPACPLCHREALERGDFWKTSEPDDDKPAE